MADYIPSTRDWVREQVELYERTDGAEGTTLRDTGLPVIIVTNQGNKTGAVRKTPLMRVKDGDNYVLVGSMGGAPKNPVWVYNLRADGNVQIRDRPRFTTWQSARFSTMPRGLACGLWPWKPTRPTRNTRSGRPAKFPFSLPGLRRYAYVSGTAARVVRFTLATFPPVPSFRTVVPGSGFRPAPLRWRSSITGLACPAYPINSM